MILISGIMIFLMVLILFFCRIHKRDMFLNLDKKEHPLSLLYPVGLFLEEKIRRDKSQDKTVVLTRIKIYASVYFAIFFTFILLFFAATGQLKQEQVIREDQSIKRPKAGEGGETYPLSYRTEYGKEQLDVFVKEQILSGVQREQLISNAYETLKKMILNGNKGFDYITQNIYLPSEIPNTQITVSYKAKPFEYINHNGVINFENIAKEGTTIFLTIEMRYYEVSVFHELQLKVYPSTQEAKKDNLRKMILDEIERENNTAAESEILQLPKKVENHEIIWTERKKNSFAGIIFLGVILAVALPFIINQQEKDRNQKRKDQMLLDYPELVSKLMLLMNAGMTLKGAWIFITEEYMKKKEVSKQTRYLYEEMMITKYELDVGISEQIVYENFGKRCNGIVFLRFGSILTQNLRKGNQGIAVLLEEETKVAFVQRKENAKRLGEKASTKLLVPTAGMLIVVIAMIMVPAFMTL